MAPGQVEDVADFVTGVKWPDFEIWERGEGNALRVTLKCFLRSFESVVQSCLRES